jgi:hypothetical protein
LALRFSKRFMLDKIRADRVTGEIGSPKKGAVNEGSIPVGPGGNFAGWVG